MKPTATLIARRKEENSSEFDHFLHVVSTFPDTYYEVDGYEIGSPLEVQNGQILVAAKVRRNPESGPWFYAKHPITHIIPLGEEIPWIEEEVESIKLILKDEYQTLGEATIHPGSINSQDEPDESARPIL